MFDPEDRTLKSQLRLRSSMFEVGTSWKLVVGPEVPTKMRDGHGRGGRGKTHTAPFRKIISHARDALAPL